MPVLDPAVNASADGGKVEGVRQPGLASSAVVGIRIRSNVEFSWATGDSGKRATSACLSAELLVATAGWGLPRE
jgi:hypothetical protein